MQKIFEFGDLQNVDLIVDAIYKGGTVGNAGDDPIHKLIGCGLQGGFRIVGSSKKLEAKLVGLYTTLSNPDWPDYIDEQTGRFYYFGDNKTPGHLLHNTPRHGNTLLRDCFEAVHINDRNKVPPFFIFQKGAIGRDVIFKGLAVPGAEGLSPTEDLIAVWKSKKGQRFQNYKAVFTILDTPVILRKWIEDLKNGITNSSHSPKVWINWIDKGIYSPLQANRAIEHRSKDEQIPKNQDDLKIINAIYEHFKSNPYLFEKCAAELARLMDSNIISYDLTRPWVDGGRDATGKYRIGLEENPIDVDFALEAKCYNLKNSVGVRETSRLISRLRYRQFGILVTTSYVHSQAYKEIKEDQHPVIIISASDIVKILKKAGYVNENLIKKWLQTKFERKN